MLFNRKHTKVKKRHHAWLYSAVFAGRFSVMVIMLLISSFLVQPFHKAMANEALPDAVVPPEPTAADVREQVPVATESPPPEESPPVTDETPQEEISEPVSQPGDLVVPSDPEPLPPDDTSQTVAPEDSYLGTETSTTTDQPDEPKTQEPLSQQNPSGSSTQIVQVEGLVNEDNFYQFSKQSCISVGEGSYHCTTKETSDIDTSSTVYAGPGADGSLEIFLKTTRGKVKQITENSYDDTAPHYDPESMRVVYQRLIDGRYQVILFDIMEEKEAQLTFSKSNNMEPKVSEAGIVWQAWDGNDWEIMLFDGSYTEQITDNDVEDVAPVIQDGYVLWNVLGTENQQARVYSLDTKETTSIQGYEGGSIINPRFVLVYDTEYENGDVVTQSFDPSTGLSEPIAAKPAQEPVNIPETDPTGEIRALITSGKTQKDEKEMSDVTAGDGGDGAPATSTTPGTLDLKAPSDSVDMTTVITTSATDEIPFELTEYDLVIPQDALENALQSTQE